MTVKGNVLLKNTTMATRKHIKHVTTLPEAIRKALNGDWENGMATHAYTVQRETCRLKVIRKCGTTERSEYLLFKLEPIHADYGISEIDYETNGKHILETSNAPNDDLEITWKESTHDNSYSAMLATLLFK